MMPSVASPAIDDLPSEIILHSTLQALIQLQVLLCLARLLDSHWGRGQAVSLQLVVQSLVELLQLLDLVVHAVLEVVGGLSLFMSFTVDL